MGDSSYAIRQHDGAGRLRLWRAWRVIGDPGVLLGLFYGRWNRGVTKAKCLTRGLDSAPCRDHGPGGLDCGLHGFYRRDEFMRYLRNYLESYDGCLPASLRRADAGGVPIVFGTCLVWGRTWHAEKGARSQFGMPEHLYGEELHEIRAVACHYEATYEPLTDEQMRREQLCT